MAETAHAAPWTTLADFYELDTSITAVLRLGAKRVALQFPDAYLGDTVAVKERLQAGVGPDVRFFSLGEKSYGSVHLDEVDAQHVCADLNHSLRRGALLRNTPNPRAVDSKQRAWPHA